MTVISEGQSLVDVSLQELGTVASLFDLADAAGLAITDLLTPGQLVPVPASAAAAPATASYFANRRYRVNTGANPDLITPNVPPADFAAADFNPNDFLAS